MRVLLLLLSILCFVTTSGYLSVASETHDKAHRPKSLLHQHLGKQTRAVLLKKKHTTHANHTSSQQGGDVDVKGPLCQIGYAFKESSFRSSWFLPGSSISTNGKHVEALLVPDSLGDPRSLFNKKVLSELWDGIAPAYMDPDTMRSISKGALGKEPYASAVDEGGQVYSFMDANKDSKRALCIFARWNLIRDLTIEGLSFSDASSTPSGSGSPSSPGFSPLKGVQLKRYTIYAMQSLKASARTYDYEDKPFTYFPKGPLPVSIFKGASHSSYWDPSAIYHEYGHALYGALTGITDDSERANNREAVLSGSAGKFREHSEFVPGYYGKRYMHKAVEVAFADAIACAGLMEDGLKHARKDHGKGRCVVGGYTIKGGYRSTPYIAYNGGSSDLVDSGTASISAIDGVPDDTLTADGIMSGRSARLNLLVDSSTELPDPRHTFDRLVKKQCYEQDTDSTFFDDFEMKALESCHYYHIGEVIGSALWSLLYNGVPVHTITRGLHRFGKFSRVPEPEPQSQEDTEETPDEGYVGYVVKLVRDSFNYVSANVDLGALVTGASAHPLGDSTSALEASTRVPTQTTVSEEGAKQTSISGAALSDDELLRRVTIQRLRDCIMQTIADSYHFAEVKGDDVFTHRFHFVVASKAFAAHGMGCKMSEAAGVASDIYVSGVRMEDYSLCADETIET